MDKNNKGNSVFDGENVYVAPPIDGETKPTKWYSAKAAPKWDESSTYKAYLDTLVDYTDKAGRPATMLNFILVDTVTGTASKKGEALTENRVEFLTEALGNATENKFENLGEILDSLQSPENYIIVAMKYSQKYGWQVKF